MPGNTWISSVKRKSSKISPTPSRPCARRIEEEKTEGGMHTGKANVYLKSVLLGSLSWSIPRASQSQRKQKRRGGILGGIDRRPAHEPRGKAFAAHTRRQAENAGGSGIRASTAVEVTPETDTRYREIGERDHFSWRWSITNRGSQDARLSITARLLNKNAGEIPVFQTGKCGVRLKCGPSDSKLSCSRYLWPQASFSGFLLFGIVGIFRRPKKASAHRTGPADPPAPVIQKKL